MICTSTVRDIDDKHCFNTSNRFWEDESDTRSGISLLSYFRFWHDIDCLFDDCLLFFVREMSVFYYKLDFIQSKEAKTGQRSYRTLPLIICQ